MAIPTPAEPENEPNNKLVIRAWNRIPNPDLEFDLIWIFKIQSRF